MPSTVSFITGTTAFLSYGNSISEQGPSSIENDDGLFVFIATRGSSINSVPSGWTLVASQSQSYNYTVTLYCYRKNTVTTSDRDAIFTWGSTFSDYLTISLALVRAESGIPPKVDELVIKIRTTNATADFPSIDTPTLSNYGGDKELVLFVVAQSELYNAYYRAIPPTGSTLWTGYDNATYNRLGGAYQYLLFGETTSGTKFNLNTTTSYYHSLVGFSIKLVDQTRGAGAVDSLGIKQTQVTSGGKYGSIATSSVDLRTYITDGEFFIDYLTDTIGANDSPLFLQPAAIEILTDIARFTPILTSDRRKTASADSSISLQDTFTTIGLAKYIFDTLYVSESTPKVVKFSQALTEALRVIDALRAGRPATVSETIGLARTVSAATAATLVDRLGLTRAVLPAAKFGTTVSERVRFVDALRKFFSGEAIDTVSFAPTTIAKTNYPKLLTDTLGVQETIGPQLVLRVVAPEIIGFDDAQVLKLLFTPELSDEVRFAAAYIDPTGGFTTWAVNTRSGATTEYINYNFNSFAKGGNKYLAASQDGLYELNGDDDDNAAIIASIRSGLMQLGNSRFTAFKDVYIGMRGDGNFVLRMVTGSGQTYNYNVVASSLRSTKVPLGKGLRARYFAFELINSGQDFDLDSVEFLPLVSHRRV